MILLAGVEWEEEPWTCDGRHGVSLLRKADDSLGSPSVSVNERSDGRWFFTAAYTGLHLNLRQTFETEEEAAVAAIKFVRSLGARLTSLGGDS